MLNDNEPIFIGLPVDEALGDGLISDYFYMKDLQRRILTLNTEITQNVALDLVRNILRINADDEAAKLPRESRMPIFLYISSPGGDLASTFSIIDAIELSDTPIYTINLSMACSGAFLIFISGHVRISLPRSTFLLHEGFRSSSGSASKVEDTERYLKRLSSFMAQIVVSRSNISIEEYRARFSEEIYMFGNEAKKKGFVDLLVGEKNCPFSLICR